MSEKEVVHSEQNKNKQDEDELPIPWKRIQGAFWLIGLAILAWQDWWWPGILVLVAFSGLLQGGLQLYLSSKKREEEQAIQEKKAVDERATWLPSVCPKCGGPISVATVRWTGTQTADCPYCSANLKPAV